MGSQEPLKARRLGGAKKRAGNYQAASKKEVFAKKTTKNSQNRHSMTEM